MMFHLKDLYRAVAELCCTALTTTGLMSSVLSEDIHTPIIRPCAKLALGDSNRVKLLASGAETSLTFRLYFFARDREHPQLENLAVRQALGDAFLDGITVGDTYLGIDEGIRFQDGDGVLEATFDLSWAEPIPEPEGEPMESLMIN